MEEWHDDLEQDTGCLGPYACSDLHDASDTCLMRADEPCNYDANAKYMSWAGLGKIPNIELSMMEACGCDEARLDNSEDTRTAFGVCDADIGLHVKHMQRRHGVRLLDAVKLVDPLALRLHECLLDTKAGARREMVYRVCFAAQSEVTRECEQRRHESLDSAIEDALHVLRQVEHSLWRFRAGVATRIDVENAQLHGNVVLFYVAYASAITEDTMQNIEYENQVLCLYRTTWTVDTQAAREWQPPTLQHTSTLDSTKHVETAAQEGAASVPQKPCPHLQDGKKTLKQRQGPPKQAKTGDANEGWPLATPMVPHPMREQKHAKRRPRTQRKDEQMQTKTPKNTDLHVGSPVQFSRRIKKFYGEHLKEEQGVVVRIVVHNFLTYYVVVLTKQGREEEVKEVNKGRKWVREKLESLGLGLMHVVCASSSLQRRP